MVNRLYTLGVLSGCLLMGCASFAYRYYGLEGVRYEEGKLLGPVPKEDLPFSSCAPNVESKHPCVLMFAKEFYAFKLDYEDTKQDLETCEREKALK